MEWRDRVRPREHPRQAVRRDRDEGPFLYDVARDLHDRPQAAVHLPEGQRARRLEGDGERLRVREGPVRDPDGRGFRKNPARGDEGPRGCRLRRCNGDFAAFPGTELLPGSGRDQLETVRAVPPGAHPHGKGRARPRGPMEEGAARRDQPARREPRAHDAHVPGRGEAAAGGSRDTARGDRGRGVELALPLIGALTTEVDGSKVRGRYREAPLALVQGKVEGQEMAQG